MIETIEFKGETYPHFQSEGFAAQFAFPFADKVCKGIGLDVGYCKLEWKFPIATGIDDGKFCDPDGVEHQCNHNASFLPDRIRFEGSIKWDYIFSSHCLEHLNNWVDVLDHWFSKIRHGGVIFLYLPHPSQKYWLPWNNRKHLSSFDPEIIRQYMETKSGKVFVSGCDLNNSFIAMCEK